jgi:hypothetical protein
MHGGIFQMRFFDCLVLDVDIVTLHWNSCITLPFGPFPAITTLFDTLGCNAAAASAMIKKPFETENGSAKGRVNTSTQITIRREMKNTYIGTHPKDSV